MRIIVHGAAPTVIIEGKPWWKFLSASNLEILNWGNDPTFRSGQRLEVIDTTRGSFGLREHIMSFFALITAYEDSAVGVPQKRSETTL
jgi:hypothetical protein